MGYRRHKVPRFPIGEISSLRRCRRRLSTILGKFGFTTPVTGESMPVKWPSKYSKTTNRHNEWSTLKKKHAAAIKASKVDFDAGLGGAVDKFENMIKKV